MKKTINNSYINVLSKDKSIISFDPFTGLLTNNIHSLNEYKADHNFSNFIDKPPSSPDMQGFIFVVTTKCNLNCKYCYSITQNKPLSMEQNDTVNILSHYIRPETKTLFINFTGGEPTLEMDVIKNTVNYLHTLKNTTIYLRISTNGLLNKKDLDYLIANKFLIIVSSDGTPDIKNSLPKRRLANKIEATIKYLAEKKAVFRVRCTVTNENLDSLSDSVKYWSSLGVEHAHIEPYHPVGNSKEELTLLPTTEEFIYSFKNALDTAENEGLWIHTSIYMNLLTPSTYFCTGASGKFRVYNPDGSITTCYRVQSFENKNNYFLIGNWKKQIETDRLYISPYYKKTEMLKKHSVYNFEKCENCKAKYICAGGCLMRNLTHGGSVTIPDPWICKVRKELLNDAIARSWFTIRSGNIPVVFGFYVFENNIINNPSIGNFIPENKNDYENVQLSLTNKVKKQNSLPDNIINIYTKIGIKYNVYESIIYKKIVRAECI